MGGAATTRDCLRLLVYERPYEWRLGLQNASGDLAAEWSRMGHGRATCGDECLTGLVDCHRGATARK